MERLTIISVPSALRQSASARGYGHKWRQYREAFLKSNPFCVKCQARGRVSAANTVDHITPHRGDPSLFWNPENHQALCAACHSGPKQAEDHRGFSEAVGADGLPIDPRHPFNRG